MTLQMSNVILPHRRHKGPGELKLVARCYVPCNFNPDGPTLLFYHCTGSRKIYGDGPRDYCSLTDGIPCMTYRQGSMGAHD